MSRQITWEQVLKCGLEYLLHSEELNSETAIALLKGLIEISQKEEVVKQLNKIIDSIDDYDQWDETDDLITGLIELIKPNETKKLNFGWWFFEYEFVYEPMAAFGVFEDEYRKQFDCDEISTLEMVEIYSDYCNSQKMPSGLIPNIVGAIAYIVFRIRHKAHLLNSSRKMRNLLKQENESDLRIQKY